MNLIFIDSISSYRGEDNQKGHLRLKFESLLSNKILAFIQKEELNNSNNPLEKEYVEYLNATLSDLTSSNGGYFSEDNASSDEDIKAEIDQILRDKEKLLSFKNADGTWNPMRFIFSKWTLREGWDNPNVFQIVKLRSSGSDISKLQEAGRGLRLPVDEKGNRISEEQFYLTYLVDYTEKDFAKQLIGEVNADVYSYSQNVSAILPAVASPYKKSEDKIFEELLSGGIIDYKGNIKEDKLESLYRLYPEFNAGVKSDKIKDNQKPGRVSIRKDKYQEIKALWENVNKKYYLKLENLTSEEIASAIDEVLGSDLYKTQKWSINQNKTRTNENGELLVISETIGAYDIQESMPYGQWMAAVYRYTKLPIQEIHKALIRRNAISPLPKDFFNKMTVASFSRAFNEWMQKEFLTRFSYIALNTPSKSTALTDITGEPLADIVQGNIGVYRDDTLAVPDKFLFDAFVYDSPKEKENIKESSIESVVVFGKIPRRSIKIPLYFGGTTSPDFMYVLKKRMEILLLILL